MTTLAREIEELTKLYDELKTQYENDPDVKKNAKLTDEEMKWFYIQPSGLTSYDQVRKYMHEPLILDGLRYLIADRQIREDAKRKYLNLVRNRLRWTKDPSLEKIDKEKNAQRLKDEQIEKDRVNKIHARQVAFDGLCISSNSHKIMNKVSAILLILGIALMVVSIMFVVKGNMIWIAGVAGSLITIAYSFYKLYTTTKSIKQTKVFKNDKELVNKYNC